MVEHKILQFTTGAMSIIQMGEEQIGHPSTAINELVKNGYDADADKCWVYTQYNADPNKNFLIIKDNGLGMSSHTLFNDWLITSRSSKRDEDKDNRKSLIYERKYLGSKGIGRLAAMALGRHLTIITKQSSDAKYNWIKIDREKFRVDSLLDEVSFLGGEIDDYTELFSDEELLEKSALNKNGILLNLLRDDPFNEFNEGTMIILQDVDNSVSSIIEEETNNNDIEGTTFYKSLVELITPLKQSSLIQKELVAEGIIDQENKIDNGSGTFQLFYGINFIKNQIKGRIDFIEIEPSKIFEYYDYRIFGKVTAENYVKGKYLCKRLPEDVLNQDFDIEPEYLLSDEDLNKRKEISFDDIPTKYKDTQLGEFYFDIRVYDLDEDSKEKMKDLLKASGRRESAVIMSRYLGLKVSKNGFGVKPYGEEEQDWLGLGAQRVKKHIVTIGPNQILGYTFLYSPENDGLSEKTNREGFFENKAFIVFKKSITGILEEAGRRRARYRLKHNLGVKTGGVKNKFERPDSEKFIQYLAEKSNNDPELMKLTKEFVSETNTSLDNMQETLTLSQRLATLGTSLELIYHELAQPISAIGGDISVLKLKAKHIQEQNLREEITARFANIDLSLDAMDELKDSLQPAIGKGRHKNFKPIDTFKKVLHLFREKIEENGITVTISRSLESLEIKEVEYPFWVSFLNIVSNSVYWLQQGQSNKIISFEYKEPNTFVISNTGPKINEDELEIIFEYGITGKKERNATGLGLAFTRNMLGNIDWHITAENISYGPAFYITKN
ncbi:sensor histidine kinase [Flavobacterium sp. CFBP9031]|uniref:sensor histidine kinase n=1 Tax=Flavobacterium sp. CFBP9031 TaxID=3096538 RepID=UPI002A6A13BA|nr:sensor histidine kinase [Flavobacterium sp. CFBP9031]MDY0989358.1 sensor histidine kinase [Flavobacterium sp. CFBP9031]